MSADRHARLRDLFDAALDLPADEQVGYVRAQCADDEALADEVLALLGYEQAQAAKKTQQPLAAVFGDWQAGESAAWIGRRLGRYELVEELGSGGMGRVFKARRFEDGVEQWVALKVVRQELFNRTLTERFSTERQILARLNHPGIAHFIDADTEPDGTAFVAMELVEGQPLLAYVAAKECSLRERLGLFRQLLAAVAHAHRALIIHRDIKPSNVLVRADGMVKLLDFGIAKPLDANAGHTQTRERLYTPVSAAPEQVRGEASDVTTDVYALGVLLYELIAGLPPFESKGVTAGELERQVLTVPPPRMRARLAQATGKRGGHEIPVDLENIVETALRKESALRYPSVEQFDADIGRFLAHEPVSVSGSGTGYRARKFIERHALATAFASLAILAMLSALTLTLLQNRAIKAERDRANAALGVLKDAFVSADPSGMAGGQVTARQILDKSAQAIAPLADQQPELYADLAATLADVQMSMGLWSEAGALIKAAVNGRHAPADLLRRLQLMQARVDTENNQVSAAKRSLDQYDEVGGARDVGYWLTRARIGIKLEQWDAVIEASSNALALLKVIDTRWVSAQQMAASAEAASNRFPQAMRRLDVAIQRATAFVGAEHSIVARLMLARIELQIENGDRALSTQSLLDLVDVFDRRFGRDSALTGNAEYALAQHHLVHERFAEAAMGMGRSADTYERALGARHPWSYRTRFNQAVLLSRAGEAEQAKAIFPLVLANAERSFVNHPQELAFFHLEAGKVFARSARADERRQGLRLLTAAPGSLEITAIDDDNRSKLGQWLAFAFWSAACVSPVPADESLKNICSHATLEDRDCELARTQACSYAAFVDQKRP